MVLAGVFSNFWFWRDFSAVLVLAGFFDFGGSFEQFCVLAGVFGIGGSLSVFGFGGSFDTTQYVRNML